MDEEYHETAVVYLLLPIVGAFIFVCVGCICGRKLKYLIHIPKVAILGNSLANQYARGQQQRRRRQSANADPDTSDDEDNEPPIPIHLVYRNSKGEVISSVHSTDLQDYTCSDSGINSLADDASSVVPDNDFHVQMENDVHVRMETDDVHVQMENNVHVWKENNVHALIHTERENAEEENSDSDSHKVWSVSQSSGTLQYHQQQQQQPKTSSQSSLMEEGVADAGQKATLEP